MEVEADLPNRLDSVPVAFLNLKMPRIFTACRKCKYLVKDHSVTGMRELYQCVLDSDVFFHTFEDFIQRTVPEGCLYKLEHEVLSLDNKKSENNS